MLVEIDWILKLIYFVCLTSKSEAVETWLTLGSERYLHTYLYAFQFFLTTDNL